MLRSIKQIYGDKLGASDGEIGQVKDFYFDDQNWAIRGLFADTGTFMAGAHRFARILALQLGGTILLLEGSASLTTAVAQEASTNTVWTATARAARKENPVPADAKSLAQGKLLYVAGCMPCHGSTGKGDGPAAATLERKGVHVHPGILSDPKMWQQTDGAIFWKLTEGNTPMPAWAETLSEEQRWSVVNYVRTLAPKPETNAITNGIATTNKLATAKTETNP